VIAATDTLAIAVIHAAYERSIGVPDQLSVVGFDDIPLASATVPTLTTVRMPIAEIVAAGVELAVGSAAGARDDSQETPRIVFQPTLIVRGSTAAAPRESPAP
jgi:LacI family transcriptional regulator